MPVQQHRVTRNTANFVALVGFAIGKTDVHDVQQEDSVPMDVLVIRVAATSGLLQDPRPAYQLARIVLPDNIKQRKHLPTKVPTEHVVGVQIRRVEVTNIVGSATGMVEAQTTV